MSPNRFRCQTEGAVTRITLDRPEVHNAFDDTLIARLTETLEALAADPAVRVVVLAAAGKSFSAGADLAWMQRMAAYGEAENLADARRLARLMATLDRLAKPTLALVQGPAIGGGVGLVACCDIALAAQSVFFQLSEVRLGLTPAVISPYVIGAIGARAARRYVLTAERFDAQEARRLGLVHQVVPDGELEAAGQALIDALAAGGPRAQRDAKALIFAVAGRPPDDALIEDTAGRIARQRAGAEGREGLAAFLDKRRPSWARD
jgi:methylglutaconyl-CoA hydratase